MASGQNTVALLIGGTPTNFLADATNSAELFGCPLSPEGSPVPVQDFPKAIAQGAGIYDMQEEQVVLCGGYSFEAGDTGGGDASDECYTWTPEEGWVQTASLTVPR